MALSQETNIQTVTFTLRSRDNAGHVSLERKTFFTSELAIIVVDVWDSHPDPVEASRVSALIPRMNQTLDAARRLGIKIIFAPNEVSLPAAADTDGFQTLPVQTQIDDGFNPPRPPYWSSAWGDMVPVDYDQAHHPRAAHWTKQNTDLIVKSGDLASLSRKQIFDYCAAQGITHLLYMGSAENMCIAYTREMSMTPMARYCQLSSILVRDLAVSMGLNGRKSTGVVDTSANVNLAMTPDACDQVVNASDETYLCSSIDSRQLLWTDLPASYTSLVASDTNLMCYWPMDSQSRYQTILDVKRNQSCWWNSFDQNQSTNLDFDIPGAIAVEPDTAVEFTGASTLLISPHYRVDIPTNSPLASLSATDFTFEAWVRIDHLPQSNQWFYAHDDGSTDGVDMMVGLNSNHHFEFVVGRNPAGDGFGDVVESTAAVAQTDVNSQRWFYIVAEHDRTGGTVSLLVNDGDPVSIPENCLPVSLTNAPHLGSRGRIEMDEDGYLEDYGFEHFAGAIDQVAIYSSVLDPAVILAHYAVAKETLAPGHRPLLFSENLESDNAVKVSLLGMKDATYVIEASTNFTDWDALSTNVASSEVLEVMDPDAANLPKRYYRAVQLN